MTEIAIINAGFKPGLSDIDFAGIVRGILDGGQLARVLAFRNRLPMMHRHGWNGPRATSATAFAWFVFDRNHHGPTELQRISWERMS